MLEKLFEECMHFLLGIIDLRILFFGEKYIIGNLKCDWEHLDRKWIYSMIYLQSCKYDKNIKSDIIQ